MNVALTRARCCLWVVGHLPTLASSPPWKAFLLHAAQQRAVYSISAPFRLVGSRVLDSLACMLLHVRAPSQPVGRTLRCVSWGGCRCRCVSHWAAAGTSPSRAQRARTHLPPLPCRHALREGTSGGGGSSSAVAVSAQDIIALAPAAAAANPALQATTRPTSATLPAKRSRSPLGLDRLKERHK